MGLPSVSPSMTEEGASPRREQIQVLPDSPAKQRRPLALIEDLLRHRRGVVSIQVMQENRAHP
jgi:hypothetical protein